MITSRCTFSWLTVGNQTYGIQTVHEATHSCGLSGSDKLTLGYSVSACKPNATDVQSRTRKYETLSYGNLLLEPNSQIQCI